MDVQYEIDVPSDERVSFVLSRSSLLARSQTPWRVRWSSLFGLLWVGLVPSLFAADLPEPSAAEVDFARDIEPIFQRTCFSCHGPEKQRSGFRLDNSGAALRGGEIGQAILPGQSAESPLIHMVAGLEAGLEMPPEGDRLSPVEIGQLRRWIDDGAKWPAGSTASASDPTDWWSLRPVTLPVVPTPGGIPTGWAANPIDAFVFEKLIEAGLQPTVEADRRTLIRRVYFDLIGLPPTYQQVEEFVQDTDPQAYHKLIDQLLDSAQYGERWARHWLDLVHFAESHGHDQDKPRESAWPYRDYVIASLNAD